MYDKSKNEKYAEKWFKENGFEILSSKQYQSKTRYKVKKNDIEDSVELPFGVSDIKSYMKMINHSFEMKIELIKLKAIKNE